MEILQIKDLMKSYVSPDSRTLDKKSVIIDIPHFQINLAEQVVLKGESGSGKSTFLNLIAGILKPDSGRINLLGQNIVEMSEGKRDQFRAEHVGYVFQTFNLLQGYTALENVLMGMAFGRKRDPLKARELLKKVDLQERIHYLPRQLSIGQQQRVSVARALANEPKLVLADEPTGNLDRKHAAVTIDLIKTMCREYQAALLLVTHDPFVLEQFDRIEELSMINRKLE